MLSFCSGKRSILLFLKQLNKCWRIILLTSIISSMWSSWKSYYKNFTINIVFLLLYWFDGYFSFWFSAAEHICYFACNFGYYKWLQRDSSALRHLRLSQASQQSLLALFFLKICKIYNQWANPVYKIWTNGLAAFTKSNPFCSNEYSITKIQQNQEIFCVKVVALSLLIRLTMCRCC